MNSTLYRLFGSLVRTARLKSELTQDDLGKRMGVSRTAITNIEKGNQGVSLLQLYEFAENLNINPAELLPIQSINAGSKSTKQMRELVADKSDQALLVKMLKERKNASRS